MKHLFFKTAVIAFFMAPLAIWAQKTERQVTQSKIEWEAKKITGKHDGTIQLKEGVLEFEGTQLVGGKFVVDMTTIIVTDLTGSGKEKLEAHLKSDDFFGVDNHPTATLVVKSANKIEDGYYVNADLTIKGITHPVGFELEIEGNKAEAELKIDRTLYNIRYGSGSFFSNLGDNTIYDHFEIEIEFTF